MQEGPLGRSVAVKVHSALQSHLNCICTAAGTQSFEIRCVQPYRAAYLVYTSKKRDKLVSRAAADATEHRAATVYLSLGRDQYARACQGLVGSSLPEDARNLSMLAVQVQTVSRGDDIRDREGKDLAFRYIECIGGCAAAIVAVAAVVVAAASARAVTATIS